MKLTATFRSFANAPINGYHNSYYFSFFLFIVRDTPEERGANITVIVSKFYVLLCFEDVITLIDGKWIAHFVAGSITSTVALRFTTMQSQQCFQPAGTHRDEQH
jgi:hypothetical protein